jgi:hypothetical protein
MGPSNNKPFVVMLVLAVVVGVGIGGVIAGGMVLGNASGDDTPVSPFSGGAAAGPAGSAGPGGQGQFGRGQVPSGQAERTQGQPDPSGVARQSPDRTSDDAAQRFPGRGAVTGTVENIEGEVVTITTPQGPVEVTIGQDTAISRISEAGVADLQPGARVTVMGPADEGGRVAAASLVITPEDLGTPAGRDRRGDQGFRREAEAPGPSLEGTP